jgi:hypothetical protein
MMPKRFTQLASGTWPSGRSKSIAILRAVPTDLRTKYGISFTPNSDDLSDFDEAILVLDSGRFIDLIHRKTPSQEIDVWIDSLDSSADALYELAETLGLEQRSFTWTAQPLRDASADEK